MDSYCCCAPLGSFIYGSCTFGHGFLEALCPFPISSLFSLVNGSCLYQQDDKEIFIVTGGNRGVGYYTAKILLQRGLNVCILSRDRKNGEEARDKLIKHTGNKNCRYYVVDLNDLSTVKGFLDYVYENDLIVRGLVNNAGMIGRLSMNANHIGHFALTIGLCDSFRKAVKRYGRVYVINVASIAHIEGAPHLSDDFDNMVKETPKYDWYEYAASKAANVLFGMSFHRNYMMLTGDDHDSYDGISLLSYHPGVMLTDLWRNGANDTNESMRERTRALCCCCVKHPMVAAIGLSSLVHPRSCYHLIVDYFPDIIRTACVGSASGSYFQQACCCCVIPVRFYPVLLASSLQDKLWTSSMEYIAHKNSDLYHIIDKESITKVANPASSNRSCVSYVSPNLPCTECIAVAPFCICLSILC